MCVRVCACVRTGVCVCVGVYVTEAVNFKHKLMEKLLLDYNPKIRPVLNHTTPTVVTVMLTLKQLRRLVSSIVAKDPGPSFMKPCNFTRNYAVYWSHLTANSQCSLRPVL